MSEEKPRKRSASMEEHRRVLEKIFRAQPFNMSLGLEIEQVAVDEVSVRLPYKAENCRTYETLHGGAVSALADAAAGLAAISDYERIESLNTATVNMLVNYLAAARPGSDALARARVRKRGRSICVIDVDVTDDTGRLIATGTITYMMGAKLGLRPPAAG